MGKSFKTICKRENISSDSNSINSSISISSSSSKYFHSCLASCINNFSFASIIYMSTL